MLRSVGWLIVVAAIALSGSACSSSTQRSPEGSYCSTSDKDDPFYTCDKDRGLACFSTFTFKITQGSRAGMEQPVYVCRVTCSPTAAQPCPASSDVCCPGTGYQTTAQYACVPPSRCAAIPLPQDGGVPTTGDAGGDGGVVAQPPPASDAGATDADIDSGAPAVSPDAPLVPPPSLDGGATDAATVPDGV